VDVQGGSNMTGTAAVQCGLFTHKSVLVISEPPCTYMAMSSEFFNEKVRDIIKNSSIFYFLYSLRTMIVNP
jgi:hypothetical protein